MSNNKFPLKKGTYSKILLEARNEYNFYNYPEDYKNYIYANKTKFITLLGELSDDESVREEIISMKEYIPRPYVSDTLRELETLEVAFKLNISSKNNTPNIANIDNREERKRIYYSNNYAENLEILKRIVILRNMVAKEEGYENWHELNTIGSMAKRMNIKPLDVLLQAYEKCKPFISNEVKLLADTIGVDELWEYDIKYALKVYQDKHTIKNIEKYFPHEHVIDRTMRLIAKAFSGKFIKNKEITQPWTTNIDGMYEYNYYVNDEHCGVLLFDTHKRQGKSNTIAATHQIIVRCVYSPKGADIPTALVQTSHGEFMTLNEIIELLHELGHAMHILSSCNYNSKFSNVGYNNVPYDFIETPSQIMENYAHDPCVIKYLSTGITYEQAKKLIDVHQQFYHVDWMNTIGQALFDTEIHTTPKGKYILGERYNKILQATTGVKRKIDNTTLGSFTHIIDYSGRYYSYVFSRMLADQNKPYPTHTLGVAPPKPHL
jgi:Zn-dependent oligopeptidase